jgi:hypothetical protein
VRGKLQSPSTATSFEALCQDQSFSIASQMCSQPMPSSVRATASAPDVDGPKPDRIDELHDHRLRCCIVGGYVAVGTSALDQRIGLAGGEYGVEGLDDARFSNRLLQVLGVRRAPHPLSIRCGRFATSMTVLP